MGWQPIGDDGNRWWYDESPGRHLLLHEAGIMVEHCYDVYLVRYWPSDPIHQDRPLLGDTIESGPCGFDVHELPSPIESDDAAWAAMIDATTWPRPEPTGGWGPR